MNKIQNRTPWPRWARAVSFALLAAVVCFIFSNSMQVAEVSNQTSVSILDRLLEKLPFLQEIYHSQFKAHGKEAAR